MKFIFPQNYNFKVKLLGFIEYTTLFLNIIWGFFVYLISCIFSGNIFLQITVFIVLFFPFLLFSIIGFNNESLFYIIKYLYTYLLSPKYYVYKKNN